MVVIYSKINGAFQQFGFVSGLLYLADRALSRFSRNLRLFAYELMVQPISNHSIPGARLAKNLEIREIRLGDPEIDQMPVPTDVKRSRFEQNATCLGAFQRGRFVGYMWFCSHRYDEDEVRCTFVTMPAKESVFDFDFFVFPEHRMGIGFVGLWDGANQFLRERGVRYTYSRLTRFNLASRRAHAHLGWKLVGRAIFLHAWQVQAMVATVAPYFHVCVGRSQPPRLTLYPDVLHV